jgi:hypothetical protein
MLHGVPLPRRKESGLGDMTTAAAEDGRICSACIENKHLKRRISDEGEPGRCSECNRRRKSTVGIMDFGKWLEPVLANCLCPGDEMPFFHSDDDSPDYQQEGEELEEHIPEILGQTMEINEEIARAVRDAEIVDYREGGTPLFDDGVCYVRRLASTRRLDSLWERIEEELKYRKRFFNTEAKSFFDAIFFDIDTSKAHSKQTGKLSSVIRILRTGSTIFRARICTDNHVKDTIQAGPWKHVGPPPRSLASEGRMNGKGVVMFYGAMDRSTCIAELRPPLQAKIAVIQVKIQRNLRLLDFTRLENCRLPKLDYFQPDYQSEVDKFFFRLSLGKRISQPVTPGEEHNYLVTQTMAEYLAFIHMRPLDGILFRSSQMKGGKNVVLFSKATFLTEDNEPEFSVGYVAKSLEFHSVDAVRYRHHKVEKFERVFPH